MGINFIEVTPGLEKITYQVVPELPPPDFQVNKIRGFKRANMETNGFTDSKNERLIGIVPYSVMYNYALMNGIKGSKDMNEFYTDENGKRMRQLLNEFSAFRMVEKV